MESLLTHTLHMTRSAHPRRFEHSDSICSGLQNTKFRFKQTLPVCYCVHLFDLHIFLSNPFSNSLYRPPLRSNATQK